MTQLRLQTILRDRAASLAGPYDVAVEATLDAVASDLALFDATQLRPDELYDEFDALVGLYRAVRAAHAAGLAAGRAVAAPDRVVPLYYALRSIQASLFLAYGMAGSAARPPVLSPVGTAIGLFDAPKVVAQETHVRSGSYDHDLDGFARWMVEIWTDMTIREADYLRFYGGSETEAARQALRRLLGLVGDDAAVPGPDVTIDPVPGPDSLRFRAQAYSSDAADPVGAIAVIESVAQEARTALIGMALRRAWHGGVEDEAKLAATEAGYRELLNWPYPVGETPLVDLDAEQRAFDALLAEVPRDYAELRDPTAQWSRRLGEAVIRACTVEQSLRDHAAAYPVPAPGSRRRGVRWYIWEFLELVREATSPRPLGVKLQSAKTQST